MSIAVTGVNPLGSDRYWAVKDSVQSVVITATTAPNDETGWNLLAWTGASSVSADKRTATLALDSVNDVTVSAKLDGTEKSATIEIYDLVSLTSPLPSGKAYASNDQTRLKVVTNPDEAKVWQHLVFSEGAPTVDKNECDVDLDPVGARTVSVTLGDKTLDTDLDIRQWPTLQIKEIEFECHTVLNDGAVEIGQKFDRKWIRGRKDPAQNQATNISQSPLCFTRGNKIKLKATFEVVDKATGDEKVKVEADLGFGKIEGTVDVLAGAGEATLALSESSAALPSTVGANSAWTLPWRHLHHDGTTWLDAGKSTHLQYVLLGDPLSKLYLTLLDVSCVAAHGKSSADELVAESFKPFAAAKGAGNGFERRGDGVRMSYYNRGSSTATGDDVQTTAGMLGSTDGTGRCGGWATLLTHMWNMHGVTSTQRWFIRATDQKLLNFDLRFLVKNCDFKSSGTRANSPYSHEGALAKKEVEKKGGIPGHGQDNPQFDFGDHVVVKYGGKLYDPSYGVGPYDTDDDYLTVALAGLGKWPKIDFRFSGVDQHIPTECVPYAEGFSEYTIIEVPLEFVAKRYGVTATTLMAHCDFYQPGIPSWVKIFPAPATPTDVPSGTLVVIHTVTGDAQEIAPPTMTLADIALKHGKTQDEIFDHAKNAQVKALRTTKAALATGDTIVVSKALDPNCWLVVGHDL